MKRETPSIPPCGPSASWKNSLTSGISRKAEGFLEEERWGFLRVRPRPAPRPPKRDAPIPGDSKGSTRQPDSGAEEREVWLLPHVLRPGEEESPGLLRGLERTGRRSPSALLGFDPPASQALFRRRRRGKAHPRPPRWTFASSRGRLMPP